MKPNSLERTSINSSGNAQIRLQERDAYKERLADKIKVKTWIRTLLHSYRTLPKIIDIIDKIIIERASEHSFLYSIYNFSIEPETQFNPIIDLAERKNKLVNIYVMIKRLFENLSKQDYELAFSKFCDCRTNDELAEEYNLSNRTLFRRIDEIIESLYKFTLRNNWSLNFIELQVKEEDWLIEKYNSTLNEFVIDSFR